jgi:uncharacterized protein YbaP (TraB family)
MNPARYLVSLLILVISCYAYAENTTQKFSKGLLWRIQKQGVPDSFIFGTIHLTDPRVTKLPPQVEEVFRNNTATLCTEIPFDQANLQLAAMALFLPQGKSLKTIAGDKLFSRTTSLLEKKSVPPNAGERLKPWAAMMILTLPNDPGTPLDGMLYQDAQQRGLELCGLETIAEQTGVMDGFPIKSQILMLQDTIDNYALIPGVLEKMTKLYLVGDLAGLMEASNEGTSSTPAMVKLNEEFTERVLISRNNIMADRAEPRLKKGKTFIAVGALHLYGEKGLLSLLEKRGYQVTRIY